MLKWSEYYYFIILSGNLKGNTLARVGVHKTKMTAVKQLQQGQCSFLSQAI